MNDDEANIPPVDRFVWQPDDLRFVEGSGAATAVAEGGAGNQSVPFRESQSAGGLIDVPDVRQSASYDCGAAALRSVCLYYGRGGSEAEFIAALGTDAQEGTRPAEIVALASRLGLNATATTFADLQGLWDVLDQGQPVIVPLQAYGGGHYVVAIGYDSENLYVQDPVAGRASLPLADFVARWHDQDADGKQYERFGVVVSDSAAGTIAA